MRTADGQPLGLGLLPPPRRGDGGRRGGRLGMERALCEAIGGDGDPNECGAAMKSGTSHHRSAPGCKHGIDR